MFRSSIVTFHHAGSYCFRIFPFARLSDLFCVSVFCCCCCSSLKYGALRWSGWRSADTPAANGHRWRAYSPKFVDFSKQVHSHGLECLNSHTAPYSLILHLSCTGLMHRLDWRLIRWFMAGLVEEFWWKKMSLRSLSQCNFDTVILFLFLALPRAI